MPVNENEKMAGFRFGQRVRIVGGEFAGRPATFVKHLENQRCQVAIEAAPRLKFLHALFTRQIQPFRPEVKA